VEGIEAVDLPWKTLLVLEASVTWDLISEVPGTGLPGYSLRCKTIAGKVTDTCEAGAETTLVQIENLPKEGTEEALLTVKFEEALLQANERATCTVGKTEAGLIVGEQLIASGAQRTGRSVWQRIAMRNR